MLRKQFLSGFELKQPIGWFENRPSQRARIFFSFGIIHMMIGSFYEGIKQVLEEAVSLSEIKQKFIDRISLVKIQGKRIGFVVGKITPTNKGESLSLNKSLLEQRTREIEQLVAKSNIVVFSSAAIPDSMEGHFPREDFYNLFNSIVREQSEVLYTTSGWEDSKGASGEVTIAKDKKIEIWHYANGSLQREI